MTGGGGISKSQECQRVVVTWCPGSGDSLEGSACFFPGWPHGTMGWAWTSRSDAVVLWNSHSSGKHIVHISSQLHGQWHHVGSVKSAVVGVFIPWRQANTAKRCFNFSSESWLLNINQHHTAGPLWWWSWEIYLTFLSLSFPIKSGDETTFRVCDFIFFFSKALILTWHYNKSVSVYVVVIALLLLCLSPLSSFVYPKMFIKHLLCPRHCDAAVNKTVRSLYPRGIYKA